MKYKWYIITALVFLALLLLQRGCYEKKLNKAEDVSAILKLDNQTLSQQVNTKGDTISYQKAIIINNEKSLNKYTDSIFQLKKQVAKATLAYTREVASTRIEKVYIPYTVAGEPYPEYITDSFAREHMIVVPKDFKKDTSLYSIEGVVQKEGVEITQITIPDTVYGRFVEPKPKLFKRQPIEYQSFHSNPLVHTVDMSSAIYYPKKKPFLKKAAEVAILVGAGVLVGVTIK